jgi:kinesin family member 6/9
MMTSVLRDSLGGNCKTVMVATINPEGSHTDESISTCRFAQRVALIENKAVLNEEVDPTLVVKRLKQEIKALKEEVNYLREQIDGEEGKAVDLADHEERRLREQVQLYVDQRTTEPDTLLSLGGTPSFTRVHAAFRILREIACSIGGGGVSSSSSSSSSRGGGVVDSAELARLKELLDHRDNEIAILVNMVKRGKTVPSTNFDGINSSRSSNPSRASSVGSNVSRAIGDGDRSMPPSDSSSRMPPIDAATLADKRKSFDVFRKSYTHNLAIEENKNLLRARYDLAKEMGKIIFYLFSVALMFSHMNYEITHSLLTILFFSSFNTYAICCMQVLKSMKQDQKLIH